MSPKQLLAKISPSLFALVIACFFLPFVTISCQETTLVTLNGFQMATGTTIEQTSGLGSNLQSLTSRLETSSDRLSEQREINGNAIAGLVLASACAGVALSFIKLRQQAIVQAGTAALGAILLLILKAQVDEQTLKHGQGILKASYSSGYWLTFLLLSSAMILNGYRVFLSRQPSDRVNQ
jgi:hypothetical protein